MGDDDFCWRTVKSQWGVATSRTIWALTPRSREGPPWSRLPVGLPISHLISTGREC